MNCFYWKRQTTTKEFKRLPRVPFGMGNEILEI